LRVVCLRFFTVYGPRQRPDLGIRKFITMIDRGQPIPVFGDGSSGHDYIFVADTVGGIMGGPGVRRFQFGQSQPARLIDLIRTIEAALGKKAEIQCLPDQPGDVPITYADISKARKLLGYRPQTPLRQGIDRLFELVFRAAGVKGSLCGGGSVRNGHLVP
jgi:UDP-glucuronate 4-epimerase